MSLVRKLNFFNYEWNFTTHLFKDLKLSKFVNNNVSEYYETMPIQLYNFCKHE